MISHLKKHRNRGLLIIFGALIACFVLLPLARSLAQDAGSAATSDVVILGPWPIADQNPILIKDKNAGISEALICVLGAERNDGNVELAFLHARGKGTDEEPAMTQAPINFIGYDDQGRTHNFIAVTTSTGTIPELKMTVYEMETPATTDVRIVSIAMIGTPKAAKDMTEEVVSRTKANMRSMATALEAYYIDNNSYAAWTNEVSKSIDGGLPPGKAPSGLPTFRVRASEAERFMMLTTPVAYISVYFHDTFASQEGATFRFYSGRKFTGSTQAENPSNNPVGWILWSPGPDGKFDIKWQDYDPKDTTATLSLFTPATYDPTNGAVSSGDIWRIKQ